MELAAIVLLIAQVFCLGLNLFEHGQTKEAAAHQDNPLSQPEVELPPTVDLERETRHGVFHRDPGRDTADMFAEN